MLLPNLSDLLQFKHEPVLKIYRQNHSRNKLSAEDAFHEVLKYLWLAQHHELQLLTDPHNEELPSRLSMLTSMREIDDMWHEFILFTQDYTDFCQHYFGTYMHHLPNIFENAPVTEEEGAIEIDKLLPYIQKHLGDATLRVWFADFLN